MHSCIQNGLVGMHESDNIHINYCGLELGSSQIWLSRIPYRVSERNMLQTPDRSGVIGQVQKIFDAILDLCVGRRAWRVITDTRRQPQLNKPSSRLNAICRHGRYVYLVGLRLVRELWLLCLYG